MHPWIAERTKHVDSSGIRKVFDLAAKLENPINLSIGQPDFAVPKAIKQAAIEAISDDRNGYSLTQGVPALSERLQAQVDRQYAHADRRVLVTSGTSGALVLALMTMVDPGDEVICFDPYFVMYPALTGMVGGKIVLVDTYPDFRVDLAKVEAAITPRTKVILFNSPANPTGVLADEAEVRDLAELAARHNIALVSDEIYRRFCYDGKLVSPAEFNDQTIVVDGFSKTYGVTGWRLGFVHGPADIIDKMTTLQQYTYVCASATAAVGDARRAGGRHAAVRRLVPRPSRPAARRAPRGRLRGSPTGRRVLRLPQGTLGHRQRVRGRGDLARALDHPRHHLQPPRHALPHLVRG